MRDCAKLTRWGFLNLKDPDYPTARGEFALARMIEEFCAALAFLFAGAPGAKRHRSVDSYSLKHAAERWAAAHGSKGAYVSNGALIAAALARGLTVRRRGINALIDLTGLSP
jgi:hypothetical protein